MYRSERTMEQKGLLKVASIYDALSVSNREETKTYTTLGDTEDDLMKEALSKIAGTVQEHDFEKTASFASGLDAFTGVRKMIANKLGVSEGIAHDMASNVVTRSERIANDYGIDQHVVASNIVEEMKGQVIENPDLMNRQTDLHPMGTHNGKIQEEIKNRLLGEMQMSQRDAELYKDLILKQAQDLVTMLRPHKRDKIAMGIVDILISTRDLTSVYGFKDSQSLMSALRVELGA